MQLSRSVLRKLTLLVCAGLFPALPSFGFCFQPNPTVACQFLNSDAVFVGTVISERRVPGHGEEIDGWLYDLTVQELFRGPHTRTIEVYTGNDSGRFPLDVGKQYLLFASEFNGRFEIDYCGNSAFFSEAKDAIRELESLRIPRDAEIEGRISFSGIPESGTHITGVHVVVRGHGKTFRASGDLKGWFHLHVPPGKYSAEVQQIPHWNIAPYDLSYDDLKHFVARKGHGTGLQFIAGPR